MESRKPITLSSGVKCVIRKLTVQDYAMHVGKIPQAFAELTEKAEADTARRLVEDPAGLAAAVQASHVILLECVSPLTYPNGARRRIVEKDLDQVKPDEITIGELADADAREIIEAVTEFTQMNKEAAERARPFPQEQAPTGANSPTGEAIRKAAE